MKLVFIIIIIIIIIILLKYGYLYLMRIFLRNIAKDTITILNKYNIDYWVDFGTLLGIYRENDIIFMDRDVDIVLVDSDTLATLMDNTKDDFIKKGYKLEKLTWSAYRVYKYNFFADLYINKKDDINKQYIGATGETSNISYELIGTPKYINWKNINVRVPYNIEKVLEYRYGNDYMTPKTLFKGRNS